MLTSLRWLLVPVSAAFGCWSGIPLALLLRSVFDSFCPAGQRISGMCQASWFPAAEAFSMYSGAAVGACLTVLLSYAAAPAHKRTVATGAFALGAAYAAAVATLVAGARPFAACAIAAGLASLAWVWRHSRRSC